MSNSIEKAYLLAQEQYAAIGVDTEAAIQGIDSIPISIHCWQGDDVSGFEQASDELSGGIQVTGNYPGKARNIDELRRDLEETLKYLPGKSKLNLHAMYLDATGPVARDEIEPSHFSSWLDWAARHKLGLDFNPTCFSHPMMDNGFTLSHPNKSIRDFWIRHVKQSRKIANAFGAALQERSIMNIWIPDGYKDNPIDMKGPRERLKNSLDICLEDKLNSNNLLDVVESKLFGIGSESYVVGSHEFYMGYAIKNNIGICLDTGHFHPTERVSNKLSAVIQFVDNILLHVSRPVRWDSDHVVIWENELLTIMQEILRNNLEHRIHIGMDFFDASINRLVAWIVGYRNVRKALLYAALEPSEALVQKEREFDFTARLVYQEELKGYPWQAVWNYYCYKKGVREGLNWFEDIKLYEKKVLATR